tara:strand:- start:607 stop:792 length:186 start_codon:yes stop_codon:yes gene_type:complete
MSIQKLQDRIQGLEISAALQRELGNTTRAEMLQATIDKLEGEINLRFQTPAGRNSKLYTTI